MNDHDIEQQMAGMLDAIRAHLMSQQQGVSEYDLIQLLKGDGYFSFFGGDARGSHQLFCAHFLLFHVLYLLRDQLWQREEGGLVISPLKILIAPYHKGEAALSDHDPLRAYYLDLENLRNTSEQDVDELIASFWIRLGKNEQREKALAMLGLEDPVSDEVIKQTYRQLIGEHHPDRGGDHEKVQQLNWAMEQLKGR